MMYLTINYFIEDETKNRFLKSPAICQVVIEREGLNYFFSILPQKLRSHIWKGYLNCTPLNHHYKSPLLKLIYC